MAQKTILIITDGIGSNKNGKFKSQTTINFLKKFQTHS